jgi:hypothetical protein
MDQRIYLKVKIKSLAAEAKIIRAEERKNPKFRFGLAEHRRTIVRSEARHTLLAYGFLRGKKYEEIEPKAHEKPDWARVERMIEKYGAHWEDGQDYREYQKAKAEALERFKSWKPGAKTSSTSTVRGDQEGCALSPEKPWSQLRRLIGV